MDKKVVEIQQLVARFADCFDTKDWVGLAACLSDTLHVDYSDLRGAPPQTVTRQEFVARRQSALDTHHLCGNVEVSPFEASYEARASMVIYRRGHSGQFFNTHCLYTFGVKLHNSGWRICSIAQKVFWNEGEESIHPGVAKANV